MLMSKPPSLAPAQGVGVDAPADSDLYYRLLVDEVFYVGGMCASAESLSKEVPPPAPRRALNPVATAC